MFVTFSGLEGYKKVTPKVTHKTAGREWENWVCNFVTLILARKIFLVCTRRRFSRFQLRANKKPLLVPQVRLQGYKSLKSPLYAGEMAVTFHVTFL